eukprot:8125706-Alexandrium_andersonii.AAC.1
MRSQIKQLQDALALAERAPPPAQPSAGDGFFREPDPAVLVVGLEEPAARNDIKNILGDWLEEAGCKDHATLRGEAVAR